ncbi:hypothetical protein DPMN_177158 [Dreissena polymorpha]|nr:hypothetical protein DPMN_177158 [Dreissena polymorpha]
MNIKQLMCLLVAAVALLAIAPVANAQYYDYGYGGNNYGYPGNYGYGGNYGGYPGNYGDYDNYGGGWLYKILGGGGKGKGKWGGYGGYGK